MPLYSVVPHPVLNKIAKKASRSRGLRAIITEILVDKYSYAVPPRPRPTSMAADYATWPGLIDRRFSGRHMGRCPSDRLPTEPPLDKHLDLFVRKTFKPASDTSILFPMFAQWFTDGFLRTKWEEGPQKTFRFNESNHEIDLCQIYGQTEVQTHMLRLKDPERRGRLKSQEIDGEEWPSPLFEKKQDGNWALLEAYAYRPETEIDPGSPGLYSRGNFARVFRNPTEEIYQNSMAVGLEHGNSTIGHVIMNTLFLREHNRTADIIAGAHPDWDDERVFQTARNVTIAVLLHIVISDYITHIAPIDFQLEITPGMAERKAWYRTNWIPVEFALLYRWHDLIPDELVVNGESLPAEKFRGATGWVRRQGFSNVIAAAGQQAAGKIGLGNTHWSLAEDSPRSANVKKLSLEMARTCYLPGFNDYREFCGLTRYKDFESLTRDPALASKLRELYGHVDRMDWFTGLFAEGYRPEDMMGELLVTMVANDAFTQALTNPLLSKALYNRDTFSAAGLAIVNGTRRLAQVIGRNTSVKERSGDSFVIQNTTAVEAHADASVVRSAR